jgi:hypothetical protein
MGNSELLCSVVGHLARDSEESLGRCGIAARCTDQNFVDMFLRRDVEQLTEKPEGPSGRQS